MLIQNPIFLQHHMVIQMLDLLYYGIRIKLFLTLIFFSYIRDRLRMNLKDFTKKIRINLYTISRSLNNYQDINLKTKQTIISL